MSDPSTDDKSQEAEHAFDGSFPRVHDDAPDTKPWVYWTGLAILSMLVLYGLIHVASTDIESEGVEVTIEVTGAAPGDRPGDVNAEAAGKPEEE